MIGYYPGCTLKNNALNFENSAKFCLEHLGVQYKELDRWNCCGTVFSLATDDLIHHVAPIRNLVRARESGFDTLLTLCAMCYNTLKRADKRVTEDPESLDIINNFMDREKVNYQGDVKVLHLLEFLRDEFTFKKVAAMVKRPLEGIKIACYYGCLLVRPKGIGFDDMENPKSLENLMDAIGAAPVDFPYKTECCGAYHTVKNPELVAESAKRILTSARERGADAVVVSCPLCAFNLDHRQKEVAQSFPEFKHIPVMYFTQAMAMAFGCGVENLGLDLHYINPEPVFGKTD